MDRAKIVDAKSYRKFAGASWPTYEDFIAGANGDNDNIKQEIVDFFDIMMEKYKNLRLDDGTDLALLNQQRQRQIFYNKHVEPGMTCRVPWKTLGVNSNGELFICQSPSWIPKFVGNLLKIDNIYTALNSELAQSIRQEILNGSYRYCNEKICSFFAKLDPSKYKIDIEDTNVTPVISNSDLLVDKIPSDLILDFDYTCNFKCPSCRTELINWNNDHLRRPVNDQISAKIKKLIIDQIDKEQVVIRWCGGEPFISEVYLDLLEYIISKEKPNIQHVIMTNGSNLKSRTVRALLPYIKELRVSFDAATPETYALTRVNGNWTKLLENIAHIQSLGFNRITADFVVQKDNYHEIPQFVELCKTLDIKKFNLTKMWNWGTWDDETFWHNNVYNPKHPEYLTLKQYFKQAGQNILNG